MNFNCLYTFFSRFSILLMTFSYPILSIIGKDFFELFFALVVMEITLWECYLCDKIFDKLWYWQLSTNIMIDFNKDKYCQYKESGTSYIDGLKFIDFGIYPFYDTNASNGKEILMCYSDSDSYRLNINPCDDKVVRKKVCYYNASFYQFDSSRFKRIDRAHRDLNYPNLWVRIGNSKGGKK